MKANELRIGNYFTDITFFCQVSRIEKKSIWGYVIDVNNHMIAKIEDYYEDGEYHFNLRNISPIPLTEEWLLKFGFRKKCSVFKFPFPKNIETNFWIRNKGKRFMPCFHSLGYNTIAMTRPIKYVHQLQNLYFALTGKELLK
jgi:hypothetical protein